MTDLLQLMHRGCSALDNAGWSLIVLQKRIVPTMDNISRHQSQLIDRRLWQSLPDLLLLGKQHERPCD